MSNVQNHQTLVFAACPFTDSHSCCLDMSATKAKFGSDLVESSCASSVLGIISHAQMAVPWSTLSRLSGEQAVDVNLPSQDVVRLLVSICGVRLVYRGQMALITGSLVRYSSTGLIHWASTT